MGGKLHNQAAVLRHYRQELNARVMQALDILAAQERNAAVAASLDALRGHEGGGAAAYFAAWPAIFDVQMWGFRGRAYYPPPDPVNAMLSFGYALLLNDVLASVQRLGLDPAVGFFHAIDYGRPSLALDLMEEFRPLVVDRLVLRLLREVDLRPDLDFIQEEGRPGPRMSDDLRRLFLALYEEQLAFRTDYPALGQRLAYRDCLDRQTEHLARCILGRDAVYIPLQGA